MPAADAILRDFYNAVIQGELEKARTFLDDRMTYTGLFAVYPTADAYLAAFAHFLTITKRLDVKVVIGQGDDAVIFYEWETTNPQANTLIAEWHHIEGGKIAWARAAFDGRPFAHLFAAV